MAHDETRPLLVGRNPLLIQRTDTPFSSSYNSRSRTPSNENYKNPSNEKPESSESEIRSVRKVRLALASILFAVVLERLAYYGLAGNLVLFLNKDPYYWESYNSISASFLFFGISYVMSLFGGWISDSLLGRFKTIILAYIIYLCGYIMLPFLATKDSTMMANISIPNICHSSGRSIGSYDLFSEPCAWLIFLVLIIIAAGTGILKANICPFGADQLVQASQQTYLSFFNLFYWCVNIGSFLGLGVIAYIQQQNSFKLGFIICAVTLGSSAIIFVAGRCFYVCRPPAGSVLTNIFKILREAMQNKRKRGYLISTQKKTAPEGSNTNIDEVAQAVGTISFLDYAKHVNGGIFHSSLVDDVKKLGMILAVFTVLIPYWLVYFQMQTTFLVQGLHMKLDFLNTNGSGMVAENSGNIFKIAAAWFSLFDAVAVIILLPLFDRVIYPRMARAGHPFTFGKRIVLGMLFAITSMVVAGIVEYYRLKAYWTNDDPKSCDSHPIEQQIGDTTYYAANMSVFWQIPQYVLIGISEVFASVASLQFAVTVAPKSMKAVVTGLFYFISGIASFLGIAFVLILASTNTWFQSGDSGNINCKRNCLSGNVISTGDCQLDYYFFSLAGLEAAGLILFLVVSRVYTLNSDEHVSQVKDTTSGRQSRHIQQQTSIDSS